jgi:hypothetical protein
MDPLEWKSNPSHCNARPGPGRRYVPVAGPPVRTTACTLVPDKGGLSRIWLVERALHFTGPLCRLNSLLRTSCLLQRASPHHYGHLPGSLSVTVVERLLGIMQAMA